MWTLDSEMMSVALMGTSAGKGVKKDGEVIAWDQARLGPTVILLELVGRLRSTRIALKRAVNYLSLYHIAPRLQFLVRFCGGLTREAYQFRDFARNSDCATSRCKGRLQLFFCMRLIPRILQESNTFVPFSQRILFCALFFEIRLLNRSLKV